MIHIFFQKASALDLETGEKKNTQWRVIRLENRYKEKGFPYVEFPIKYITKMIDALVSIEKTWYEEEEENTRLRMLQNAELKKVRQTRLTMD